MKFIEKLPNWLRWILIPIICPIAWIVIAILAKLAAKILIFFSNPNTWSENLFEYLLNPAVSSYLTIALAIALAPTRKKIAGLFIVFLLVAYAGVLTFLTFLSKDWPNLIMVPAIIVGCYLGINETSIEN